MSPFTGILQSAVVLLMWVVVAFDGSELLCLVVPGFGHGSSFFLVCHDDLLLPLVVVFLFCFANPWFLQASLVREL
ncbi:hypothetical protein Nepgr_013745 [Nepenthes gracilis]|uniref:Uncharacterized protein n=1 Tax=Nepenthes gracilis TaxID=150966 RepID=A0AAD3SJG5_NEPGR|nr:hypothetical protein Nepgr_013745 [Nepenthes gracilis]